MRQFKIEQVDKYYFSITISGVNLGRFERSEVRHLIETFDNIIGSGL